jgi:hypothetical protein
MTGSFIGNPGRSEVHHRQFLDDGFVCAMANRAEQSRGGHKIPGGADISY